MPRLDDEDIYKFMIYTALRNNFILLSAEFITAIGGRIIVYDKQFFKKHEMGKIFLESRFLCGQKPIQQTRFKKYTRKILFDELEEYAANYPIMNTDEIIDLAKHRHHNVLVHAYDACYMKFTKYIAVRRDISLVYFVKDYHIHPITDERLKNIATKANGGNCTDLWKYMSEIKWTRRQNQIEVLESIDDQLTPKLKNKYLSYQRI